MIMLFQTLFLLFSIFAIVTVLKRMHEGMLSFRALIFWILFWVGAAVVVIWPNSTQVLANHLGIGRGTDVVMYMAMAIVFFILFRLHIKIESLNRAMTKVVRQDALDTTRRT